MSISTARRRARKQTKEEKRQLKRRSFEQRRTALRRFPKIVYEYEGVPDRLVDAVKTSVKRFVSNHESILGPGGACIIQEIKNSGLRRTYQELQKVSNESGWPDSPMFVSIMASEPAVIMGNQVLSQLPSGVFQAYFPFSDLLIAPGMPRDDTVLIRMQSLCTAKTRYGTAYFSPYKPVLETEAGQSIVAFSDHAVRRICQRTVGSWENYLDLRYAFAIMHNTVYFEPWKSRQRERGFVVYKEYFSLGPNRKMVERILGDDDPNERYFYRVGYCPATVDCGFLRAKTLLLPGMRGTPEYEHFLRPLMTSHEKRTELERQVQNLAFCQLEESDDLDIVKNFHDSGIPQVVSFDHEIARMEI